MNKTLAELVEEALTDAVEPKTVRDLAKALDSSVTAVRVALAELRKTHGDRLRTVHQGRTVAYHIERDRAEPSQPRHLDLFRGWYNPATGITGSRLG